MVRAEQMTDLDIQTGEPNGDSRILDSWHWGVYSQNEDAVNCNVSRELFVSYAYPFSFISTCSSILLYFNVYLLVILRG